VGKKVFVKLFGKQNRFVKVDSEATEGAQVGSDLLWPDGSVVQEDEIRGGGGTTDTDTPTNEVSTTLWELILNIPQKLTDLLNLVGDGYVFHQDDTFILQDADSIGLTDWPIHKDYIGPAETLTITPDFQYLIWQSFDVQGVLNVDGRLVILGEDESELVKEYVSVNEERMIPEEHQLLVTELYDVRGTLDSEGTLSIL
jgi:hypothetical protein